MRNGITGAVSDFFHPTDVEKRRQRALQFVNISVKTGYSGFVLAAGMSGIKPMPRFAPRVYAVSAALVAVGGVGFKLARDLSLSAVEQIEAGGPRP